MGWTAVERRRLGGGDKGVRKAEIVDGRGVTTFWSTPDGLYKSWRPHRGRHETRGGTGDRKQVEKCAAIACSSGSMNKQKNKEKTAFCRVYGWVAPEPSR